MYRTQHGRYFVAVSLLEAETLRANMHLQRSNLVASTSLLTGSAASAPEILLSDDTSFALHAMDRLGTGYTLDATEKFGTSVAFMTSSAESIFRFVDSQTNLSTRQLHALLRCGRWSRYMRS